MTCVRSVVAAQPLKLRYVSILSGQKKEGRQAPSDIIEYTVHDIMSPPAPKRSGKALHGQRDMHQYSGHTSHYKFCARNTWMHLKQAD